MVEDARQDQFFGGTRSERAQEFLSKMLPTEGGAADPAASPPRSAPGARARRRCCTAPVVGALPGQQPPLRKA
jgi:hypothetical protein